MEILDDKGGLVEKVFESKVHTYNSYTYSAVNAFKPLNTGTFKIKASTTDDVGKQENKKEWGFTVQ